MKKIVFTVIIVLFSSSIIQAQKTEKKKENVYVKLKEGASPIIYVDGKIFNFSMDLIDQSKIESVSVFKGKEAIKKYNAPNGVVLIKTKGSKTIDISEVKKHNKIEDKNQPMVIIDGKVSNKKTLDKITPDTIEKMEVLKGEKAIEKYNSPNGVIIITTKKK